MARSDKMVANLADKVAQLEAEKARLHTGEGHAGCDVQTCEIAAVASDEASGDAELLAENTRLVVELRDTKTALANLDGVAHEYLARAQAAVAENTPLRSRMTLVESSLRNVKDYCEEMFSPGWLADPRNREVFAHRVYAMVRVVVLAGAPLGTEPAGGPEQDRGAAALRSADLPLGHAFVAAPFYPALCDVKVDDDGRVRTCARPAREHAA